MNRTEFLFRISFPLRLTEPTADSVLPRPPFLNTMMISIKKKKVPPEWKSDTRKAGGPGGLKTGSMFKYSGEVSGREREGRFNRQLERRHLTALIKTDGLKQS